MSAEFDLLEPVVAANEIQGNILGGFNKDHQAILPLRFDSGAASVSAGTKTSKRGYSDGIERIVQEHPALHDPSLRSPARCFRQRRQDGVPAGQYPRPERSSLSAL